MKSIGRFRLHLGSESQSAGQSTCTTADKPLLCSNTTNRARVSAREHKSTRVRARARTHHARAHNTRAHTRRDLQVCTILTTHKSRSARRIVDSRRGGEGIRIDKPSLQRGFESARRAVLVFLFFFLFIFYPRITVDCRYRHQLQLQVEQLPARTIWVTQPSSNPRIGWRSQNISIER